MLKKYHFPLHVAPHILIGSCLAVIFVVISLFFPTISSAHTISTSANGPTFQINAGFAGRYKDGNWVPIQITLRNDGPDFTGSVAVDAVSPFAGQGSPGTLATYQVPINLPNGAQKQVTLTIPISTGAAGTSENVVIRLLDSNGQTINTGTGILRSLGPGDVMVGILSDQGTAGFSKLNAISLPNQGSSLITQPLDANTLPETASTLKNFDVIILDHFATSTLKKTQLDALESWVNQGGSLIIAAGPEGQTTLGGLPPALLPIQVSNTVTLPAGSRLLPVGGPGSGSGSFAIQAPVVVSNTTLAQNDPLNTTVILANGTLPLIVQKQLGQGNITYLAFDPTLEPVASWSGATSLWQGLIVRNLGEQLLSSQLGAGSIVSKQLGLGNGGLFSLQQSLLPNAFPSPWLPLGLLAGYIIILGPVRFFVVRWRKRRDWSWRIVLITIVLFSGFSYGLALSIKGTSITSNTISIMSLTQGGTSAHLTTYLGVFPPGEGNYTVHFAGSSLVQPSMDSSYNPNFGSPQANISINQDGSDAQLLNTTAWSLRSLTSEQDLPVKGGIISQLNLANGHLSGTVTNTLPYGLSDVYVLMPNSFVSLGRLDAGATKSVPLDLNTTNNQNQPQGLAYQIAQSNGGYYYPYGGNGQLQSELQRHMAILSLLTGNGYAFCGNGPCPVGAVRMINKGGGVVVVSSFSGGGPLLNQSAYSDPLLIPGAPATLIGWADQSAGIGNDITINGSNVGGLQETLIQAPLNVAFSGNLVLPTNYITGELVDVNDVQMLASGLYTMNTGSATFELKVPNLSNLQLFNLSITEPGGLSQIAAQGAPGGYTDVINLQTTLYNWQTGSWDTIALSNYTFTTQNINAYVGPGGRVLVKFENTNTNKGQIAFAKPTLVVTGNAG